MLWQPLSTKLNSNIASKFLSRISSGDHKRTWQGVSAKLLPYLYKLQIVHASLILPWPKVHVSSMYNLWSEHAVTIHYDIFPSRLFYLILDFWHYMMWSVMWLSYYVPLHYLTKKRKSNNKTIQNVSTIKGKENR